MERQCRSATLEDAVCATAESEADARRAATRERRTSQLGEERSESIRAPLDEVKHTVAMSDHIRRYSSLMFISHLKDSTPQVNGQSDLRHLFAYDVSRTQHLLQ